MLFLLVFIYLLKQFIIYAKSWDFNTWNPAGLIEAACKQLKALTDLKWLQASPRASIVAYRAWKPLLPLASVFFNSSSAWKGAGKAPRWNALESAWKAPGFFATGTYTLAAHHLLGVAQLLEITDERQRH